jgi:spermidine synthase
MSRIIWLMTCAFCAGFVITGIELAAGRLLAPQYGSGVTIWALVIAFVIAAISAGYMVGGLLYDRYPKPILLYSIMASSGIACAWIGAGLPLILASAHSSAGFSYSEHMGLLTAALGAISIPCFLLASLTPGILKETLSERRGTATYGGLLYGVGSIGSVAGILMTAVVLIPALGIRSTFFALGLMACIPASCGIMKTVGAHAVAGAFILAVLGSAALPSTVPVSDIPGTRVLDFGESAVQHWQVLEGYGEKGRSRYLQLDDGVGVHSVWREKSSVSHAFYDFVASSAVFAASADGRTDVAIIGSAGGTVSSIITRALGDVLPEVRIIGVELDAALVEVGDRYLGQDRTFLTTHVSDGRVWLNASRETYDVIILDAYRQPSIPAHLCTREFFTEVNDHLAPGGIAVINVWGRSGGELVSRLGSTWRVVFPEAHLFHDPRAGEYGSHLLLSRSPGVMGPTLAESHDLFGAWRVLKMSAKPVNSSLDQTIWTDDWSDVERLADTAWKEFKSARRR